MLGNCFGKFRAVAGGLRRVFADERTRSGLKTQRGGLSGSRCGAAWQVFPRAAELQPNAATVV